jgi:hypothetical protein
VVIRARVPLPPLVVVSQPFLTLSVAYSHDLRDLEAQTAVSPALGGPESCPAGGVGRLVRGRGGERPP